LEEDKMSFKLRWMWWKLKCLAGFHRYVEVSNAGFRKKGKRRIVCEICGKAAPIPVSNPAITASAVRKAEEFVKGGNHV
jgi:hypothetical protein